MAWGRLALIHAAGEPDETLEKMAILWGYQRIKKSDVETAAELNKTTETDGNTVIISDLEIPTEISSKPRHPPALFIVVSKLESLAKTDPNQPTYINNPDFTLKPDSNGSYCFPAAKPLLSMARLIPLLHNGLGQKREGNNIDLTRLSSQLAKGKALHRLPYLPHLVWPQRLQIIVDARLDLETYWVDFVFIVHELKRLLGKEAVTAIRFDEESLSSEQAYCLPYPATVDDDWLVWQQPATDEAVLILSDLKARYWSCLLKRLEQRSAPILTLSPSTTAPDNLTLCQLAKPNPLNDKQPLPRYPHQKGFKPLPTVTEEKRCEIFALLSTLPLIDAALLRRLRLELNWGGSELEYFIWQHSEVRNNGLGIYFPKRIAESYQQYYPNHTAEKFWQIVNDHHADAFHGLKCLEGANQYAKGQAVSIDIKTYFQQLCATLHQTSEHSPRYSALQAQAKTVIALVSQDIFATELNDTLHDVAAFGFAEEISADNWQVLLDLGLNIEKLQWKLSAEQQQLKTWHIVQQGQGQFVCIQAESAPLLAIATISGVLLPVSVENGKEQVLAQRSVTLAENDTLTIKTDLQQLELKAIKKPSWATSIGRDLQGLFVTVPWLDEPRLYWQHNEFTQEGQWQCHSKILGTNEYGDYVSNYEGLGVDEYGLYADFTIQNITQRLRWIEPGTFLMGSPPDELGRWEKRETQHQVTLTQGYWLADTACTQALWQSVMGNNPSRFTDNLNNPVESVNWNDVQMFINRLNNLLPDIQAKLPSEAQWEYACRAGTTTPFSFGENITPEQVNYDGNHPYNNAEKGLYREKTVPVKSLPANAWGLYEMHGNVREWCQDFYANYSTEPVINPVNDSEGSDRVLRGGSWHDFGGYARSAYRLNFRPNFRSIYIGFRFSLGLQIKS